MPAPTVSIEVLNPGSLLADGVSVDRIAAAGMVVNLGVVMPGHDPYGSEARKRDLWNAARIVSASVDASGSPGVTDAVGWRPDLVTDDARIEGGLSYGFDPAWLAKVPVRVFVEWVGRFAAAGWSISLSDWLGPKPAGWMQSANAAGEFPVLYGGQSWETKSWALRHFAVDLRIKAAREWLVADLAKSLEVVQARMLVMGAKSGWWGGAVRSGPLGVERFSDGAWTLAKPGGAPGGPVCAFCPWEEYRAAWLDVLERVLALGVQVALTDAPAIEAPNAWLPDHLVGRVFSVRRFRETLPGPGE